MAKERPCAGAVALGNYKISPLSLPVEDYLDSIESSLAMLESGSSLFTVLELHINSSSNLEVGGEKRWW